MRRLDRIEIALVILIVLLAGWQVYAMFISNFHFLSTQDYPFR